MAYTGTWGWTGYGWLVGWLVGWLGYGWLGMGMVSGYGLSFMIICPKQSMVARLSPLSMAYTVFSNPKSETFDGLEKNLKIV